MDINQLLMIQLLATWLGQGKEMDLLLLPEINFPGFKPHQYRGRACPPGLPHSGDNGPNSVFSVVRQILKKENPEGTAEKRCQKNLTCLVYSLKPNLIGDSHLPPTNQKLAGKWQETSRVAPLKCFSNLSVYQNHPENLLQTQHPRLT